MKISEILKETQQDVYIKLDILKRKAVARTKEKEKEERRTALKNRSKKIDLGNVSIEELMSSRYYRRGRGGAIKQVR